MREKGRMGGRLDNSTITVLSHSGGASILQALWNCFRSHRAQMPLVTEFH